MKMLHLIAPSTSIFLVFECLFAFTLCAAATDLTANKLTLQSSMNLGQVSINGANNAVSTVPGLRMSVTQDSSSETFINTIYYEAWIDYEHAVHEEYGWIEVPGEGYWQDIWEWGWTGYWVDEVWGDEGYYDENGDWIPVPVLLESGGWVEEWGEVWVGQEWVGGGSTEEWGVIGTYTTYEPIYHDAYTETVEVTSVSYQRPKIKFAATRNDANWVWQVPTSNADQNNMKDVFVLFDGGAKVVSADANVNMALMGDNLTYSKLVSGGDFNAVHASKTMAGKVELESFHAYSNNGNIEDKATLESRSLTFNYKYTNAQNQPATKLTRIGAESSHFDGLVTVSNNLHVQGAIRVAPAGNLSMGVYTQGPPPSVQP